MISTTKALNALNQAGYLTWKWERDQEMDCTCPYVSSDLFTVSDETYGDKSFLYFRCRNPSVARDTAKILRDAGGKPNFKWCKDDPSLFEIQVSYFKGWHHWE